MKSAPILAELFLRESCVLGEGPFWYEGRLWWVDIEQGHLLSYHEGHPTVWWSLGQRVGAAVPLDHNTFVLALEKSIVRLDLSSRRQKLLHEVEIPSGHRFNDGKCDPAGRFVVGTMDMNGACGTDILYSCEGEKAPRFLRGGLSISNGLAWSEDGATFYHIDTPGRTVSAFDYDLQNGTISRERTILTFLEQDGFPDGMTIDREGRLWIAFWDGWAVRCYHPESQECLAEIRVPCSRPTSCCFGGPLLDQLFITTARRGFNTKELSEQPLAGSIFVCNPRTTGFPGFVFL